MLTINTKNNSLKAMPVAKRESLLIWVKLNEGGETHDETYSFYHGCSDVVQ